MQKRILILDDNDDILSLCKIILRRHNYFVETRTRCDDIVFDVLQVQPDIIILDLMVPEIGSEHVLQLIKANL